MRTNVPGLRMCLAAASVSLEPTTRRLYSGSTPMMRIRPIHDNQVELSLRRRIFEPSRDHLPAKVKMANPPELESLIIALHRRGEALARRRGQELDNPRIAQAILYARSRGIDIDLYSEQDYLRSPLQTSIAAREGRLGRAPLSSPSVS
jgi:hypothetical protein